MGRKGKERNERAGLSNDGHGNSYVAGPLQDKTSPYLVGSAARIGT